MNMHGARRASAAALSSVFVAAAAGQAGAITVNINPVTVQSNCAITVSGTVSSTPKLPATAATIDFLPPNNGSSVRLVTNLPLQAGGAYTWTGPVPSYPSIPANSQVKVWSNRQTSATAPVPVCTPVVWQTINFSGLVSGQRVTSYTQGGFNLSGNDILAGDGGGLVPPAMGAFPGFSSTVFTFKKVDGSAFALQSLMLSGLNGTLPAQTVVFTGYLKGGGTVSYTVTAPANTYAFRTYTFPATFTNLTSIVWTPNITIMSNMKVQ